MDETINKRLNDVATMCDLLITNSIFKNVYESFNNYYNNIKLDIDFTSYEENITNLNLQKNKLFEILKFYGFSINSLNVNRSKSYNINYTGNCSLPLYNPSGFILSEYIINSHKFKFTKDIHFINSKRVFIMCEVCQLKCEQSIVTELIFSSENLSCNEKLIQNIIN